MDACILGNFDFCGAVLILVGIGFGEFDGGQDGRPAGLVDEV